MKLNYRDRIVLTVLIVVLVWVGGVMLFIKPAIERLQDSQAALDDAKATRSDLQDRVDADADLPERIVTAYKEVTKMTESFYSVQETQEASQMIDDLLDSDELKNLDMNISDYSAYTLNPYAYIANTVDIPIDDEVTNYMNETPVTAEDAMTLDESGAGGAVNAEGEAIAAPATIGSYTISFNFTGTLDDMEKFCEKLQTSNDQKTMVVENLNYNFSTVEEKGENGDVTTGLSDTDIEGNMELTMMVVQKLPDPNSLA